MISLYSVSLSYQKLLDIRYVYHLGHRHSFSSVELEFTASEFPHLAGLHKVADIAQFRSQKREKIFHSILSGNIDDSLLSKSRFISTIEGRLLALKNLENLLDSEHLIFHFCPMGKNYSQINADYVLNGISQEQNIYLFLIGNGETYHCCSIFPKTGMDYTKNQR